MSPAAFVVTARLAEPLIATARFDRASAKSGRNRRRLGELDDGPVEAALRAQALPTLLCAGTAGLEARPASVSSAMAFSYRP